MQIEISESADLVPLTGRRIKVKLIEGDKLGTSGFYPSAVIERDGPKIFKKGTPMFLDHQTPEERALRPNGSVKDYAAVLEEDAYYSDNALYADVTVFATEAERIKELKDHIGVSIRAAGIANKQEIDGKLVPVFESLDLVRSVDFVMKAGAGGKIVDILESSDAVTEIVENNEGTPNMEKVLEAFEAFKTELIGRLDAVEEAVKPAIVEEVTEVEEHDVLETAKLLANSTLSEEGRSRVLELSKVSDKSLADLITAEESYIKTAHDEQLVGIEESAAAEAVTELAQPKLWSK